LGNQPIIFIRFNPDDYYDESQNLVKSCWTKSGGICEISKRRELEWQSRLNCLRDVIQYWISNAPEPTEQIHTEYLFYNKCDMSTKVNDSSEESVEGSVPESDESVEETPNDISTYAQEGEELFD
jgi:hypothetical protein